MRKRIAENKTNLEEYTDISKVGLTDFTIFKELFWNDDCDRLEVTYIDKLSKATKIELKEVFSSDEVWALNSILRIQKIDSLCVDVFDSKRYMRRRVESYIQFEKLTFPEESTNRLVEKLDKLNQFQAFTLLRMIAEYWNCNRIHEKNDLDLDEENVVSSISVK